MSERVPFNGRLSAFTSYDGGPDPRDPDRPTVRSHISVVLTRYSRDEPIVTFVTLGVAIIGALIILRELFVRSSRAHKKR